MVYNIIYHTSSLCRGNGQPGSLATASAIENLSYGRYKSWTRPLPSHPITPTNQRAELTALIFALDLILQKSQSLLLTTPQTPTRLNCIIYTDSRYALTCVNEKMFKYAGNQWRNSYGHIVANEDLIRGLWERDCAVKEMGSVRYEWVGKEGNALARRVAREEVDGREGGMRWNTVAGVGIHG